MKKCFLVIIVLACCIFVKKNESVSQSVLVNDLSSGKRKIFNDVDFKNISLRKVVKDFGGMVFYKADLSGQDLSNLDLRLCDFSYTILTNAKLNGSRCDGVKFIGANCTRTNFRKTKCQGADFSKAILVDTKFNEAVCEGVKFIQANCAKADFHDAQCQNGDFSKADLSHVQFIRTNVTNMNIEGAILYYTNFDVTIGKPNNIGKAMLPYARFKRFNQSGKELYNTDFTGDAMNSISFFKCDLLSSVFNNAGLEKAVFIEVQCCKCTFVNAALKNASLKNCGFCEADFTKANLDGADVTGSDFSSAKVPIKYVELLRNKVVGFQFIHWVN